MRLLNFLIDAAFFSKVINVSSSRIFCKAIIFYQYLALKFLINLKCIKLFTLRWEPSPCHYWVTFVLNKHMFICRNKNNTLIYTICWHVYPLVGVYCTPLSLYFLNLLKTFCTADLLLCLPWTHTDKSPKYFNEIWVLVSWIVNFLRRTL